MELHERMKRQALAEFESYRQRVEDMQLCTEAQVDRGLMCSVCVCVCVCVCVVRGICAQHDAAVTAVGNQY